METLTISVPRILGVHEAKRWFNDPMGYDVLRNMLQEGSLLNKAVEDSYRHHGEIIETVIISVGNHNFIVNHTDHVLRWIE